MRSAGGHHKRLAAPQLHANCAPELRTKPAVERDHQLVFVWVSQREVVAPDGQTEAHRRTGAPDLLLGNFQVHGVGLCMQPQNLRQCSGLRTRCYEPPTCCAAGVESRGTYLAAQFAMMLAANRASSARVNK